MNLLEFNLLLKQIVTQLIQNGFKLTALGKVLLGANGFTPISKWYTDDNEVSKNFGYNPLARIGKLIHRNLYLVYLKDDELELLKVLESKNMDAASELKEKITNYLNKVSNKSPEEVQEYNLKKLDNVLMNILGVGLEEDGNNTE